MATERTKYMQQLLDATYSQGVAFAVLSGTINGSWEQAIRSQLRQDINCFLPQAEVILQAAGGDLHQAAKIVIDSIITVELPALLPESTIVLGTTSKEFDQCIAAYEKIHGTDTRPILLKSNGIYTAYKTLL